MNPSIIKAIDAYGGKETWTKARSIEAEFSARGLAFDRSEKEGLKFTSHRRVTPRSAKGKPLSGPTLIEIKIHNYQLIV